MHMEHNHKPITIEPVKVDININVDWDKATDSVQTIIWSTAIAVVLTSWFMKH